jgi:hypothetical protein
MEKKVKKVTKPFSKLTKAEKRVAIAKDVLAQIELETIYPTQGTYIGNIDTNYTGDECKVQVNSLMKKKDFSCDCCAKGALFMSHVNKTNHLTLQDLYTGGGNNHVYERLGSIFSIQQLDLIECAFEGDLINDTSNNLRGTPEVERAIDFVANNGYESTNDVLIGICENIIKNKGTFIP